MQAEYDRLNDIERCDLCVLARFSKFELRFEPDDMITHICERTYDDFDDLYNDINSTLKDLTKVSYEISDSFAELIKIWAEDGGVSEHWTIFHLVQTAFIVLHLAENPESSRLEKEVFKKILDTELLLKRDRNGMLVIQTRDFGLDSPVLDPGNKIPCMARPDDSVRDVGTPQDTKIDGTTLGNIG